MNDNEKDSASTENVGAEFPFVSVVVPVYNDEEALRLCLRALQEQRYPPDAYEVIVVDNGSDCSPARVVPCDKRFFMVQETAPGSYAARNRGLKESRGTIIAFTDADCIPSPNWIAKGVQALSRHPNLGLLAGRIDVVPANPGAPTLAERYQEILGFPQKQFAIERHFGATANVFTRKAVIDAVGAFDSSLKSGGDLEWGRRVYTSGFAVVYGENVVVKHAARSTVRGLWRQAVRVAGGRQHLRARNGADELWRDARHLGSAWNSFLTVWRDPRLPGFRYRLGVIGIGLIVRMAHMLEGWRLKLGAPARR